MSHNNTSGHPASGETWWLTGKVALVTGAARGLGRAIELAKRGADIVVHYNNSSSAAYELVTEIQQLGRQAVAVHAEMSSVSSIRSLFAKAIDHYGSLSIVVSNAGVNSFSHLKDTEESEFDTTFGVNTKAQYFVAQEAFHHLKEGGRIVLTSSRTAQGRGFAAHAVYAGSKGAVETFVRCLAVDCGEKKITINAIAPGATMTDQFKNFAKYVPDGENMTMEEGREVIASWHPLKRPGEPEDIGRVVAFLVSDDGGWINGQVIAADGGIMR
ncbi:related to Versicolorin reductase [Cephalotrichum gorgonifer]|uniref:Related to Versicolorin reductase n=1 Tax=Cephalotrichum gorgonifer TaxID=2041049 RepID=A0AAE8MXS8_9PEZI|nr:related to Versicolorin reductase [Cephalotrichum gorgonifer]